MLFICGNEFNSFKTINTAKNYDRYDAKGLLRNIMGLWQILPFASNFVVIFFGSLLYFHISSLAKK